jgi:heme A synthase
MVYMLPFLVGSIHMTWGYVAVSISGVVGLWGVLMARREKVPRLFYWGVGVAITALLLQVTLGVITMSTEDIDPGNQHVFYGVVVAVTFAFTYIYRAQFRKRPALYYGLLLLFTMGLGIRGIMTFGHSF